MFNPMSRNIPEIKLSSIDYEILAFINKYGAIHKTKILKKFPEHIFSTEQRIKTLSFGSIRFMFENYIELEEKDEYHRPKIKRLGTYSLTDEGLKSLSDYILNCKVQRKEKFWKIFPIIISAIALLKSFDKELILIWKLLVRLLQ